MVFHLASFEFLPQIPISNRITSLGDFLGIFSVWQSLNTKRILLSLNSSKNPFNNPYQMQQTNFMSVIECWCVIMQHGCWVGPLPSRILQFFRQIWLVKILKNRPQTWVHNLQTPVYFKKMREVFWDGHVLNKTIFPKSFFIWLEIKLEFDF